MKKSTVFKSAIAVYFDAVKIWGNAWSTSLKNKKRNINHKLRTPIIPVKVCNVWCTIMNDKKMCDRCGCNGMAVWVVSWMQKSERSSVLGYTYISSHVFCDFNILYFNRIINKFNLFLNCPFSKKSFITI
jgi:hypothetical protein